MGCINVQPKGFRSVLCHKDSYCKLDVVFLTLGSARKRAWVNVHNWRRAHSIVYLAHSECLVMRRVNVKKHGEGETKKIANCLPCILLRGDKTRILGTKENWVDIFAWLKKKKKNAIPKYFHIHWYTLRSRNELEVWYSPWHILSQCLFIICSYYGFQFTDRETETQRTETSYFKF